MSEYNEKTGKIICVDFDGVLHVFPRNEWKGEKVIEGLPVTGASEVMNLLKKLGWTIIIYSARAIEEAIPFMEEWLKKYDFPFDQITDKKVYASIYLDDRGLRFKGDWLETLNQIDCYTPWLGY